MRSALTLLVAGTLAATACGDPSGPPRPASMSALTATQQDAAAGSVVAELPAVRVLSGAGRPVSDIAVTFTVEAGGGSITGGAAVTDSDGLARVTSWTLGPEPGVNRLVATIAARPGISVAFEARALPQGCPGLHTLDHGIGDVVRLKTAATDILPCLFFDPAAAAGHEYLLLLESMPVTGPFNAGLFPGPSSGAGFDFTLRSFGLQAAAQRPVVLNLDTHELSEPVHAWDFGAGRIRELQPETPPEGVPAPQLLRDGRRIDLGALTAEPAVGDTIEVRMEGLPRLGISVGNQKAVIRHVTPHIIIAEDVRLSTTLVRESGGLNAAIPQADLEALASEYAANAMVQGDMLFEHRHNTAVEQVPPHRVIAVHSLMPADDIWGYTYSSTNYFVWDFWVGTDGVTRGLNQHPQRVADNLFMHEIAHMRHWGVLQRAGSPPRGNRWLVEGFARFTERLPIMARLLGSTDPSRTGNVVLPRNPAFNNAYFLDDVPTYGSANAGMFFGYQTSAFVFDYFADQVAFQGGDWRVALRELVTAAGAQATIDPVVQRWTGVSTFAELFTRSRIALYTDDLDTPGLPAWTQYHSVRLRESRALPQQLQPQDPRNAWTRISIAGGADVSGTVAAGGAAGFVLDAAGAAASAIFAIVAPSAPRVNVTLVRIR